MAAPLGIRACVTFSRHYLLVRRQHNIVVCHLTEYFEFVAVFTALVHFFAWIYIANDGVSPALCLVRLLLLLLPRILSYFFMGSRFLGTETGRLEGSHCYCKIFLYMGRSLEGFEYSLRCKPSGKSHSLTDCRTMRVAFSLTNWLIPICLNLLKLFCMNLFLDYHLLRYSNNIMG